MLPCKLLLLLKAGGLELPLGDHLSLHNYRDPAAVCGSDHISYLDSRVLLGKPRQASRGRGLGGSSRNNAHAPFQIILASHIKLSAGTHSIL